MMRSPYRRPTMRQDRKAAPGNHPRLSEASQRSNLGHGDTFDWRPEVEVVTGPPRIRPVPFVSLPPDGGDAL
jgi:hypothetical protein